METALKESKTVSKDKRSDGATFYTEDQFKWSFIPAILFGLFSHLYVFTNMINNHDNIVMKNGYGGGIRSGRWFLSILGDFIGYVWGNYNVYLFIGMAALVLLAFSSYLILKIFDIRSRRFCLLFSALFVSFPAAANMFLYMFTAFYYAVAIALAVASVYCVERYKYGWMLAVLLATLSMGIYQAYIGMTMSLYLVLLIKEGFQPVGFKVIFKKALRYLGIILVTALLYVLCLKLSLSVTGLELYDYQGIDSMGAFHGRSTFAVLWETYRLFFAFFSGDYCGLCLTRVTRFSLVFVCLTSVVLLLFFIQHKRENFFVKNKGIGLLFILLFPLVINSVYFMSYGSYMHTMMIYSFVFVYLLPIVLLSVGEDGKDKPLEGEDFSSDTKENVDIKGRRYAKKIMAMILIVVSLNYAYQSNGNYVSLHAKNIQLEHYLSSIITAAKSVEGFEPDLKWAILGKIEDPMFPGNYWMDSPFKYYGNTYYMHQSYSYCHFIYELLGYNLNMMKYAEREALLEQKEIQDMPNYPADGSIQIRDGVVIIKMSNSF